MGGHSGGLGLGGKCRQEVDEWRYGVGRWRGGEALEQDTEDEGVKCRRGGILCVGDRLCGRIGGAIVGEGNGV